MINNHSLKDVLWKQVAYSLEPVMETVLDPIEPIGYFVAPVIGCVALPLILLNAASRELVIAYHTYRRGPEEKNYQTGTFLKATELGWLECESKRLKSCRRRDRLLSSAKIAAKAIIPIFGFAWILRTDWNVHHPNFWTSSQLEYMYQKQISWCQFQIDQARGEFHKYSLAWVVRRFFPI